MARIYTLNILSEKLMHWGDHSESLWTSFFLDQRQSLSFIRKRNGHRRSRTGVTSSTKHSAETREREN